MVTCVVSGEQGCDTEVTDYLPTSSKDRVCRVSPDNPGDVTFCLALSAKLCCRALADDFQVASRSERMTKCVMKMDLIISTGVCQAVDSVSVVPAGAESASQGREQVLEMCLLAVPGEERSEARADGPQAAMPGTAPPPRGRITQP